MAYLTTYSKLIHNILLEDAEVMDVTKERPFSPKELEQAFEMIKDAEGATYSDITDIVSHHLIDWPRGKNSLRLLLIRMYGLMFGDVPDGVVPNIDWYSIMTRSILDFIEDKGYDVTHNYFHVMDDAQAKIEAKKLKRSKEEAANEMSNYFKNIKQTLVRSQINMLTSKRNEILNMLMNGQKPNEVFDHFLLNR